jgi:hypothetical protein
MDALHLSGPNESMYRDGRDAYIYDNSGSVSHPRTVVGKHQSLYEILCHDPNRTDPSPASHVGGVHPHWAYPPAPRGCARHQSARIGSPPPRLQGDRLRAVPWTADSNLHALLRLNPSEFTSLHLVERASGLVRVGAAARHAHSGCCKRARTWKSLKCGQCRPRGGLSPFERLKIERSCSPLAFAQLQQWRQARRAPLPHETKLPRHTPRRRKKAMRARGLRVQTGAQVMRRPACMTRRREWHGGGARTRCRG